MWVHCTTHATDTHEWNEVVIDVKHTPVFDKSNCPLWNGSDVDHIQFYSFLNSLLCQHKQHFDLHSLCNSCGTMLQMASSQKHISKDRIQRETASMFPEMFFHWFITATCSPLISIATIWQILYVDYVYLKTFLDLMVKLFVNCHHIWSKNIM